MMDPTRMAYGVNAWGMAQYGYNGLRSLDDRWLPDKPSTKNPSSFSIELTAWLTAEGVSPSSSAAFLKLPWSATVFNT